MHRPYWDKTPTRKAIYYTGQTLIWLAIAIGIILLSATNFFTMTWGIYD